MRVTKKKTKSEYTVGKFIVTMFLMAFIFFALVVFGNLTSHYLAQSRTTTLTTTTTTQVTEPAIDYEAILNHTKQLVSEANIYIQVNMDGLIEIGSGTIFMADDDYYYALTCEHVIDGNGSSISSKIVKTFDEIESDFEIVASDEILDIAIIKFSKESRVEIFPISFEDNSLEIDNLVISVGNPSGNIGSITFGSILEFTTLNELEITREVIMHSSTLFPGYSGGGIN